MAYQKQIWENLPSVNTPLSADRLNHMEDGIADAWEHGGGGGGDTLPIGIILPLSSSTIPEGYLLCDGSAVSRTEYSTLFSVIGTTYGDGDGSTTFNLPDLQGKVPVGQDSEDTDFDTLGETGGSKDLQEHSHTYNISTSGAGGGDGTRLVVWNGTGTTYNNASGAIANTGTGNSGNLQPYLVVKYIIKVSQTTSTQAQVVDGYSTSTTDSYSCNYVNGLNTYSTTEQRIGTWMNKPLYRKVFKFGAMPKTTNKDIPHNISNLGITVNCYGMAVRSSDSRALIIPDSVPGGEITCGVTNTNVYVTTYSDRSSFNDSHIIIEYTKTTD